MSDVEPVAAALAPDPGQGLILRTEYFRLDWTLRFTDPTISIDDRRYRLPWGSHYFALAAGSHRLGVSYPYLRLAQAGKASMTVDVPPDEIVHVSYRPPISVLLAFRPGQLAVRPPTRP